ncbi:hypothetical protein [Falsiroseomonas sp.]|uniref:hypothetical protein n=1 Tax=Falsiroseomonas sp. TaxID=2870721 RepID=UPI0027350F23|nr:hypothetical protein [Falsiroseomonas sp.]MDP3418290.1 hypothetical protein [Falsiroseomonas sp.]
MPPPSDAPIPSAGPGFAPPPPTPATSGLPPDGDTRSDPRSDPQSDPWSDPWAAGTAPPDAPAGAPPQQPRQPALRLARRWRWPWPWQRASRPADAAVARLRALGQPEASPPNPARPDPAPLDPPAGATPAAAASGLPFGGLPPLRVPMRPLVEGLGGLLLLAALDRVLTGGNGFAHYPASPFMLPVLYVAARYGLVPGVAVALAAGLLRIGLAVSADLWTLGAWALPLFWPLLAALVGGFSEWHLRRLRAAEDAVAAAEQDRAAIAEANQRLAERALELDARLGARLQATTAVFEAARMLGGGTEGVIRGATGLLRAATGCTACSFWLAEDRTLHLVAAEGWPQHADPPLAHTILPGPLTDAIAQGRGALVATRLADRLALGGEGLLAAPVLSPWDGFVLGMVKIEDLGFDDLGLETIAALEAAAGWIGAALAEARAREAAEAASGGAGSPAGMVAAGGLMVPGEEASRAIAVMTGLARRLGFELALLSAEIPAGPRGAAALEATRAAMAEAFRGSDLLLESRLEERRLSILLPGAAVAGAEAAAARLRGLLAERAPSATTQVVVGVALLHGMQGGGWQVVRPHG